MFEVIAIWDGEFYMHQALCKIEAQEWLEQYAHLADCKTRIWQIL